MIKKILDRKTEKSNSIITMKKISQDFKLSAVILTKNEENNIVDCIESVLWCDEIIVVDDVSQDRTVEIVNNLRDAKIIVFTRPLENDFSAQRNYGLEKARGEWVLFIDSDERVTEGLKNEIQYVTSSQNLLQQKLRGFYIRRADVMWSKKLKYGETGNIRLLRLVKKDAGKWIGKVHEVWKVRGKVGQLKNPLYHYPHQSISEFLQEVNFYTDLRAKELFDNGVKVYWISVITYPLGKFLFNFILKRGFLDGLEGFVFALMMSFHSFLVRGKLWFLWNEYRNHKSLLSKK